MPVLSVTATANGRTRRFTGTPGCSWPGDQAVSVYFDAAQNNKKDLPRSEALLRCFSTAGRSFDLSVTVPAPHDLVQANRLLKSLTAEPRPWTFRSCDLSLRLPGSWRAAINPRSGCYPVITLDAPGVRVVLTELRATERASGRVVRESGRRFRVEITPASATRQADAVLATLRATVRR